MVEHLRQHELIALADRSIQERALRFTLMKNHRVSRILLQVLPKAIVLEQLTTYREMLRQNNYIEFSFSSKSKDSAHINGIWILSSYYSKKMSSA
jgi:hypothetical protein